jgi:Tfp pilus assembly PilM family ATPase
LAKYDEISSTERLLDLIRDDNKSEYIPPNAGSQRAIGHRLKNLLSIPVTFRKVISVGVDLGHDDLKIIKIHRVSDRKFKLFEFARIPYDPDIARESPQFHQFLKPILADFCGNSKNVEIWCTISSARVETRQIRIPKVNPRLIPNSVYWSYQRISSFNEKDSIFDFEVLGEVEEDDKRKIDVIAYTAPKTEIKDLKDLFSKAGFPLTGISIVPFAFQNLLRTERIKPDNSHISSLYIGRDWSRIDIFSEGCLVLSRGIKAGVKTMLEALRTEIEGNLFELSIARSPTKDAARIRAIKKKLKYELEQAHKLFFGESQDAPPAAVEERQRLLKEDRLFKMVLPALERLVQQVEITLRNFAMQYENATVGKIYISSGVVPHKRILEYIGEELGIATETLDPFAENPNFFSLVPGPETASERSSYVPAMGMALSRNELTPNFLYTYKDKQKAVSSQRINRSVFASFLLLMTLCVGVSVWQDRQIEAREFKLQQLRQQLDGFGVRVDKNLISRLVNETQANLREVREIGEKYFSVAVISEITNLTPVNVRLLSLSTQVNGQPGKENAPAKNKTKEKGTLILDGIVQGDRLILESTLAGYLMELRNSPLFDQPTISKKTFERFENKEGLRFTARLKLI